MITFRYHIASLLAVLCALAAGVALGAGPLQRDADDDTTNTSGQTPAASTDDDRTEDSFNEAFVGSMRAGLIDGKLAGRAVTLVVLPGAPEGEVSSLTEALGASGAALTGTVRVDEKLVSPSNKQLVDELGGQLEADATKVQVAAGASSYERIGSLLAYALGTTVPAGDAIDEQGAGILAGLSAAGLVSTDGDLPRRGNLVLVAAGPPIGSETEARGTASIVRSLVGAVDAGSGGVVVAGPAAAAGTEGVLGAVRQDPITAKAVSTVDSADVSAGTIVAMLALVEQATAAAGHYGGGPGATGPRPGVAATS